MSSSGPPPSTAIAKQQAFRQWFSESANEIDLWAKNKKWAGGIGFVASVGAVLALGVFGAFYIILIVASFVVAFLVMAYYNEHRLKRKFTAKAKQLLEDDQITRGTEAMFFARHLLLWEDVERVYGLMGTNFRRYEEIV